MKNNCVFKILILLSSLLISGCKNNEEPAPSPAVDTSIYIDVETESFYLDKTYNLRFKYDDSFFEGNAKTFNKDLALLSLGHSFVSRYKETSINYINKMGFTDINDSHFLPESSIDSIRFSIAKKQIKDFTVVGLFVKSLKYEQEWGNNFMIGVDGDHLGFSLRTNEIKACLEEYIASNCKGENIKLWLSGFSRGGAIANLLASLILRNNTLSISQDNMFVYTFGAPNAVSEEYSVAYENVFNIINSADLVANVPPTSFGLKRCGIDYDVYNSDIAKIMHEFDSEINLPNFEYISSSDSGGLSNDSELTKYVISKLTEEKEDKTTTAETRELFVNNFGEAITNTIVRVFQLSEETQNELLESFLTTDKSELLNIAKDTTGVKLKNFLKPYLDKDKIEYDEDVLLNDCATIIKFVFSICMTPLMLFFYHSADLTRIISMHYAETYYALFLKYFE